jgi:hypothetical protein
MPGLSPDKTTIGYFDASTIQPCFVLRTALRESGNLEAARAVVVAPWTPLPLG